VLIGCCANIHEAPRLKRIGYDYVELSGKKICQMKDAEFKKNVEFLKKIGMACLAMNAYCTPEITIVGSSFDLEKAKKYAEKCAYRANILGVKKINIGSPGSRQLPENYDRKIAYNQSKDFFAVTAMEFNKYGIEVCIEALGKCYCNYLNTVEEAAYLCREIEMDNLKIVVDFYNMEHSQEADISLEEYQDIIGHVHISDDAGSPMKRFFMMQDKFSIHKKRIQALSILGYYEMISVEIDLEVDEIKAKQSLDLIRESIK